MATKLERNTFPSGLSENDFTYVGQPAKKQCEFSTDVGIADMTCVSQFGETNSNKFYHAGIVQNSGKYYVYLEWGRIFAGKSWQSGSFRGQDFQFVECSSEDDARKFFEKQCAEKNTKRIEEKEIGGKKLWVGKNGKDGYIVVDLAVREKGLPDAYKIKDSSGIAKKEDKKDKLKENKKTTRITYSPKILSLVSDLVGGTKSFTRSLSESTGVYPSKATIDQVRDTLIPLALKRLSVVGNDVDNQLKDQELIDISQLVATLVPRPIPRSGTQRERQEQIILNSNNILTVQNDLDAFESSLSNEDYNEEEKESSIDDPHQMLLGTKDCEIIYLDEGTRLYQWVNNAFLSMTNNRHYNVRGVKIKNIFEIRRPDRDKKFEKYVQHIADIRSNITYTNKARLQPASREDNHGLGDAYYKANVFLGIHGTRSVNVAPILQTHFRLPKQLSGVVITGANFGSGIYSATDWKKSAGYVGSSRSYYGSGGGVANRGNFMFLADVVMGDAYMATSTGSWSSPPNGKDSIAGYPDYCYSLINDEHIVFNPDAMRIKYLIELDLG